MIYDDKNKLVDSYIDSISVLCVCVSNCYLSLKSLTRLYQTTETEGNSFFKFPVFYPSSIISIPNEEHPRAVFDKLKKPPES